MAYEDMQKLKTNILHQFKVNRPIIMTGAMAKKK